MEIFKLVNRNYIILCIFLFTLIHPYILNAKTIYVDDVEDCSGTGTIDAPFCRIEDAVSAAEGGDVVFIKEGFYEYSGNLTTSPIIMKPGVTLRGAKVNATIIYGNETGTSVGIISGANNSIIENLTFYGSSYGALAIICDSTAPTIQNCIFDVSGIGVLCKNSASPVIRNNNFYASYISVESSSRPVIQNNVIVGCYHYGIYIDRSNPTVINNTITHNGTFGIYCTNASPVIKNNIITFNGQYGINCVLDSFPDISYNLVSYNEKNYNGCEPGVGDISGLVFFKDPDNWDYHELEYSTSIDKGDPASAFNNEPEPNGGRINLGAFGNTTEATKTSSPYSGAKYVNSSVKISGDGSSPGNAFKTINEAMLSARPGETIFLLSGTYTSTSDDPIYIKSGITLQGVDKSTTIIEVEPRNSGALKINGENIILKKLTIKGLSISSKIDCYDSSIEITNCYFENVRVNIDNSSQSSIHNNIFFESSVYLDTSSLVIKNNIFNGCGIFMSYSSPEITNNTIISAGISMSRPSFPVIKNNIITGTDNFGISCNNEYGVSEPVVLYNNIWRNGSSNYSGCNPGAYDISVPPSFINEVENDFHLQSTSQCVDAGDPSSDFSNEPLPNGGKINLGAYGNTTEAAKSPTVKVADKWYVDASMKESGDGTSWATAFKTITAAVDMAKPRNKIFVAPGIYSERPIIYKPSLILIGSGKDNTIIDGDYHEWSSGEMIGVHIIEDDLQMSGFFIKDSGRNIKLDGISGAKLKDLKIGGEANHIYNSITISNSSNSIIEGCEIHDSIWIESESSNIIIKNNVLKYSDTVNPYTSSDAIDIRSGSGFLIENNLIMGFESSNGIYLYEVSHSTILNNSILESDNGISVSPNCKNIKITGNIASGGVSFGSASTGLIANNLLFDSYSNYDSGITINSSSPDIFNNNIYNFFPAGIECIGTASPKIFNNIIFKVDHDYAYGISVSDDSKPIIQNNNIDVLMSGMGQLYSGIEDQTGISGNISADSNRFCDFSLMQPSVCINSGNNTVNLPSQGVSTDIHGDPRVSDGIIDIGADEYTNNSGTAVNFNIQVGNKWTYKRRSNGISYKVEREVVEIDNTTFSEPSYVIETRIDNINIRKSWYKNYGGKLIVLRNQTELEEDDPYIENYTNGLIELWYPTNGVNHKLSLSDVRLGTMVLDIQSYIALSSFGLETITLDSGTARGYKVVTRSVIWGLGEEYISDYTQWIVPSLGVIKYQDDNFEEKLISFSINNGSITESTDSDNDGLKDYLEMWVYGTNKSRADSDSDGIPDGWEATYELNPLVNDIAEDTDKDGLTNINEYRAGTSPHDEDTDNDGMPDGWEIENGLKPLENDAAKDNDNDIVTNIDELIYSLNPSKSDSDNDGMPDGWELYNKINPLLFNANDDYDKDNLKNLDEYTIGTDPLDSDTDNDGMPDGWEDQYGLDPLENDADEDSDGDHFSNIKEYLEKADPGDPKSHPPRSMPWLPLLLGD